MVDELARRVEEASPHVVSRWDEERSAAVLEGLRRRLRRRRTARLVALGLAPAVAVALLALGLGVWLGRASPRSIASTEAAEILRPTSAIYFVDGSTAIGLGEESLLVATEVTSTDVRVRLRRGSARFDVTPQPARLFQVEAGDVSVMVLGTAFTVARRGELVEVSVQRGLVRVRWPGGAQALAAGERGIFPPEQVERAAAPAEPMPQPPPDQGERRATRQRSARGAALVSAVPGETWQALAEQGRVQEAFAALERAGGARSIRGMDDALLAADVMRLSGQAERAVEILRAAVAQHPGDPRASVASFTLGRVLLNQLGRPRDAAEAFGRARRLSPSGALAEDAQAREVEAWSRAGQAELARRLAEDYVERYPAGRRLRAVRRFGGLE